MNGDECGRYGAYMRVGGDCRGHGGATDGVAGSERKRFESAATVGGEPGQNLLSGDAPLLAPVGHVVGREEPVGKVPVAPIAVRTRDRGRAGGTRPDGARPRRGRRAARCGQCPQARIRRSPGQPSWGVNDHVAHAADRVSFGVLDGNHAGTGGSVVIPGIAHIALHAVLGRV